MPINYLIYGCLIVGLGTSIFLVRYFRNPLRNLVIRTIPAKVRFSEESFNIQTKRMYLLIIVMVILITILTGGILISLLSPLAIKNDHQIQQSSPLMQNSTFLQMGAYNTLHSAQKKKAILEQRWPKAVVIGQTNEKKSSFKVAIGPFEKRKDAESFVERQQIKNYRIIIYSNIHWIE